MKRLLAAAVLAAMLVTPAWAAPTAPAMSLDPGLSQFTLAQGRVCRACRQDCYARYRTYCGYSEGCRRAFTACMRDCWYGYCR